MRAVDARRRRLDAESGAAEVALSSDAHSGTASAEICVLANQAPYYSLNSAPLTVTQWALLLERKLHAADPTDPAFAGAQVQVLGNRLQVTSGVPDQRLHFSGPVANDLDLEESQLFRSDD